MKRQVTQSGNRVTVRANPKDAAARVAGVAARRANGAPLTPQERDDLLLAIAQRLGIKEVG